MPPEATEQVIPSIIVVVADTDPRLPAGTRQAGFCGHIGEGSVAIVLIEMGGGRLTCGPLGVKSRAVGQVDIEPAVVIIVEEGNPAAFRLNDVLLMVGRTPDIGSFQSGLPGHVDEDDGRSVRSMSTPRVENQRPVPLPKRHGKRL